MTDWEYVKFRKEVLTFCSWTGIGRECPDCFGGGWTMKCYGGPPVEVNCETCYGLGYLEPLEESDALGTSDLHTTERAAGGA